MQTSELTRASMRPRVFPAEDLLWVNRPASNDWRFNEAAGIPRGRPAAESRTWRDEIRLQ